MPLKLYERPKGSGNWHVRGTVQGQFVDRSAHTRERKQAEQIRSKLESEMFKRAVYGERAVATFSDAAVGYMKAGGEGAHLEPLLLRWGHLKLSEVTQARLDEMAAERPSAAPATVVRQIYTPTQAVMNFAHENKLCDKTTFRKPEGRGARTEYLRPAEAKLWLDALPAHLERIVRFYLATGCRASEALKLEWKDVSIEGERFVLWDTKADYPRGINLDTNSRKALGERGTGRVFLNSRGEPWHGYDAINLTLRKFHTRREDAISRGEPLPALRPLHCHLLRHSWATWAYACTRDLTFVASQGGWRSLTLLGRYTHSASGDLARSVLADNWEFDGRALAEYKPKG